MELTDEQIEAIASKMADLMAAKQQQQQQQQQPAATTAATTPTTPAAAPAQGQQQATPVTAESIAELMLKMQQQQQIETQKAIFQQKLQSITAQDKGFANFLQAKDPLGRTMQEQLDAISDIAEREKALQSLQSTYQRAMSTSDGVPGVIIPEMPQDSTEKEVKEEFDKLLELSTPGAKLPEGINSAHDLKSHFTDMAAQLMDKVIENGDAA